MSQQIRPTIADDLHRQLTEACASRGLTQGQVVETALRALFAPQIEGDQIAIITGQLSRLLALTTEMAKRLEILEAQGIPRQAPTAQDLLAFYAGLAGNGTASAADAVTVEPAPKPRGLKRFFLKG